MTIGDTYLTKFGMKGSKKIIKGTVIALYPKFFLVQFPHYKECFSNIIDKGM
jgi:hypothetical protein